MPSFSKKFYYDVMKSGQEDTILESHSKDENDQEDSRSGKSTSEVGCSARRHMKSNAVQTQWSRAGRNFRNEYTNTSDLAVDKVSLKDSSSKVYAIHQTPSSEDITFTRACGIQVVPDLPSKLSQCVEVDFFDLGLLNEILCPEEEHEVSKDDQRIDECNQRIDECNGTECEQSDQCESCHCTTEVDAIPLTRGLTACRTFTLGTAEFRRYHNEGCKTKLIGGTRVPVCKTHMNSF